MQIYFTAVYSIKMNEIHHQQTFETYVKYHHVEACQIHSLTFPHYKIHNPGNIRFPSQHLLLQIISIGEELVSVRISFRGRWWWGNYYQIPNLQCQGFFQRRSMTTAALSLTLMHRSPSIQYGWMDKKWLGMMFLWYDNFIYLSH